MFAGMAPMFAGRSPGQLRCDGRLLDTGTGTRVSLLTRGKPGAEALFDTARTAASKLRPPAADTGPAPSKHPPLRYPNGPKKASDLRKYRHPTPLAATRRRPASTIRGQTKPVRPHGVI